MTINCEWGLSPRKNPIIIKLTKDSIQFGSKTIEYSLTFSKRKSLGITVTPEMEVQVKAPEETPLEKIQEKVRKRAPWILKQLSYFLSFHPKTPARKYVSGETHLYLGRQYLLKVTIAKKNEVKYKGRKIAEPLIERFKKYGVEPSGLYIQEMPTRWGSCTPKGKIILNPELLKAPKPCIEYVIIHELCHLVHHNHSAAFLALQSREMADWEKWKGVLEGLG